MAVGSVTFTVWVDNPKKTTLEWRVNCAVNAYYDRNGKAPNMVLVDASEGELPETMTVGTVTVRVGVSPFTSGPGTVYAGRE